MRLRAGAPTDYGFLAAMLREAAFPDDSSKSIADVMARRDLAITVPDFSRRGDLAVIADRKGIDVGAAWCRAFTDREHSWGYLDPSTPEVGIAVVEEHRGQGVGTALLDALIGKARDNGWVGLSLCTDGSHGLDQALYARAGFLRVGSLDNAPDAVLMRLDFGTRDDR